MKTFTRLTLIFLGFITTCFSCSQCEPPSVRTEEVTVFTDNSANIKGTITDDGNATITKQGFYYGTLEKPETSGVEAQNVTEGTTSFSSTILGLNPNTKYFLKAYAVNKTGIGYGNQVSFTTGNTTVTDNDGNVYNIVTIGTQVWMKENLKTTKYNDGTNIPNVTNNAAWSALVTSAYCWYNNDAATNKSIYGALYDWYVTNTGKLCPVGWHVPTHNEFIVLRDFLGGETVSGGKLKEIGTLHWITPNTGATNESGFTAVPSGTRTGNDGPFYYLGEDGHYWSSTSFSIGTSYHWYTYYNTASFSFSNTLKNTGYAIRCLKD